MATASTQQQQTVNLYLRRIRAVPLLTALQERDLALRYFHARKVDAAEKLMLANTRFVVKIAHEFRGYGLDFADLVQEGNLGLLMAIRKFNPNFGFRLLSYGVFWVRAFMQSFVLRSWSLVKIGTTQNQRRLFFRLRAEREKLLRLHHGNEEAVDVPQLADLLNVREQDIYDMDKRLNHRDMSLDAFMETNNHESGSMVALESLLTLPEPHFSEEVYANAEKRVLLRQQLHHALRRLNHNERTVLMLRYVSDQPKTLHAIGILLGISRERVRQIKDQMLRKMRQHWQQLSQAACDKIPLSGRAPLLVR